MLNKYKFIIMEGEFCKIIIYKICVYFNLLFLWNKTRINSPLDWFWAFTIFKCFSISNNMVVGFVVSGFRVWVNVMDAIT